MKRETVVWLIVLLGLLGGMFCFYWHQPNAPLRDYFMAQRIAGFNDFLNLLRQMDQGAFAEEGTHHELLKKGGIYADFWQQQMGVDND